MKRLFLIALLLRSFVLEAQHSDERNSLGAWYMYFIDAQLGQSSLGFVGDIQYRDWKGLGDIEQLIVRGAFRYKIKNTKVKIDAGYGYFVQGVAGKSSATVTEHRPHQDIHLSQWVGKSLRIGHRFRFEQRFVEGRKFDMRYHYAINALIPLNSVQLEPKTVYLLIMNEVFLNGSRDNGDKTSKSIFDRNWLYLGSGYTFSPHLRVQVGWMRHNANNLDKSQLLLSLHHRI